MNKNQQLMKLFLSLFICTMVIFSSSYFGAKAFGVDKKENKPSTASIKEKEKPVNEPVAQEQVVDISSSTVNMKEVPDDLQTFLNTNAKIEIPAQSSFSLLDLLKKQKLQSISGETLSMIGTGIYQAILPTDFTIEERNIGNELPANTALGDEAKVDLTQNMDFSFSNPNKTKYTVEFQLNGSSLAITLKGAKLPYDYKIVKKNKQIVKPKTVLQYSPLLASGHITVKDPGKDGQSIEVYRETYKGNILTKSELIANDYYPPVYRVEIHALDNPTQQSGTTTDAAVQSDQQAVSSDSTQNSQTGQTASDGSSTNGTNTTSTNDSSLWGKPNEVTK